MTWMVRGIVERMVVVLGIVVRWIVVRVELWCV